VAALGEDERDYLRSLIRVDLRKRRKALARWEESPDERTERARAGVVFRERLLEKLAQTV
jgi:hypothetical protein